MRRGARDNLPNRICICSLNTVSRMSQNCLIIGAQLYHVEFAGAYVIARFDVHHEDASVANFSGSRSGDDGLENFIGAFIGDYQLDHDLWQEGYTVFRTS